MYSFTKPKPKPLFKEDTKLWLVFYFISVFLFVSFALFLLLKAYFYNKDTQKLNQESIALKQQIIKLNTQKELIFLQKTLYENVHVKNSVIKTSIKNLLDLIPDPITLDKFLLSKNKLIIYGITPTKDIYNMLMLPPLESIFESTKTYFYQLPNGWYRFKSINIIKADNENAYN